MDEAHITGCLNNEDSSYLVCVCVGRTDFKKGKIKLAICLSRRSMKATVELTLLGTSDCCVVNIEGLLSFESLVMLTRIRAYKNSGSDAGSNDTNRSPPPLCVSIGGLHSHGVDMASSPPIPL